MDEEPEEELIITSVVDGSGFGGELSLGGDVCAADEDE